MPEVDPHGARPTEAQLLEHLVSLLTAGGKFQPSACALCREIAKRRAASSSHE